MRGLGRKSATLRRKAFTMILRVSLLMLFAMSTINFAILTRSTLQSYKRETAHDLEYAVSLIDAAYLERIYASVRQAYYDTPEEIREKPFSEEYIKLMLGLVDDDFWQARDIIVKCMEKTELASISLLLLDEEEERIIFVIDGYELSQAMIPGQWLSGEYSDVDSPKEIKKVVSSNSKMFFDYGTANGWVATNYIEVHDLDGNLLGYAAADINITDFVWAMLWNMFVYILLLMVVVVISAQLMAKMLENRFIVPVNTLANTAQDYTRRDKTYENAETDKEIFDALELRTGDEIETLWVSLSDMERDINKTMRRIRSMAAEKEKAAAELAIATGIQQGMLPRKFPAFPGRNEFDIYAFMRPAKEVGGDLYDFFLIDDDHLCMAVGDVSGKGVPAALFMAAALIIIKDIAQNKKDIKEIMKSVNNRLIKNNKESLFITVWLGIYCISERKLTFANAGHEDPAFYSASQGQYSLHVTEHDIPMGIMEDAEFESEERVLEPGDKIFIYSDGVPEACRKDDVLYSTDRMIKCLNRSAALDGKGTIEAIRNDTEEFIEGADQFDDMTMLYFEVK